MIDLNWVKCQENVWCSLERVNLDEVSTNGVYIIWHAGNPSRVVRLGQGDISARLKAHRLDPKVLAYKQSGNLFVTWAAVEGSQQDGMERYLADTWPPLVGEAFPQTLPLAVNSPFG